MSESKHHYGARFHLINNFYLETLLTNLCLPQVKQPHVNQLIERLYLGLIEQTANTFFATEQSIFKTRMSEMHPESLLKANTFKQDTKVVSVNLARAGTYPSHLSYSFLHHILPADNLRQDHIFAARTTNNQEKVTGTYLGNSKIGGDVDGCYIIFPDPMGATGSTIASAIDYYEKEVPGLAKKYIAINLIVTPEYLKKVLNHSDKVEVVALRVDRGLSSKEILASELGQYWDQEKGLNDKQYIVPGAGGLGELLNNANV